MSVQPVSSSGTFGVTGTNRQTSLQLAETKEIERQQVQRADVERQKEQTQSAFINGQGQLTGSVINVTV